MNSANSWRKLSFPSSNSNQLSWLDELLQRNGQTEYLKLFGSPSSLQAFRDQVPLCSYDDLHSYLYRIFAGEENVLFHGKPVGYEKTGGSTGGSKILPFSQDGLGDFQRCLVPWLSQTVRQYNITGRAYFSLSPVLRKAEFIGGVPIGLSDLIFLGEEAGAIVAAQSVVPPEISHCHDITEWRQQTIAYLINATDLELISVWSPTFLLRLLETISHPSRIWPHLKVISCWASGTARRYADQLRHMFPTAVIQPKGLLSTETVVTIPDDEGNPILTKYGFVEFGCENGLLLENQLELGSEYEIIATTASGLYRYKTGDRVCFTGRNSRGQSILEFIGRDSLTVDMVGEKLTESFVSVCLNNLTGFAMLVPDYSRPGYVLVVEKIPCQVDLMAVENRLCANPQYAYARQLNQLAPLQILQHPTPLSIFENVMLRQGMRIGDIKPHALRSEPFWLDNFKGSFS